MTGQQLQMPLEALVKSDHEFAPIPYEDNAAALLPFIPDPSPVLEQDFEKACPGLYSGLDILTKRG